MPQPDLDPKRFLSIPIRPTHRSWLMRYGVAVVAIGLLVLIAATLHHFSINFNASLLIIAAIVAATWYGGLGPGLTAAALFELAQISFAGFQPGPMLPQLLAEVNRTVTVAILVILISGRKRAQDRLREQREWLRVALSSIGDAVIATDLKACVTFLNPVAESLTGWEAAEAVGRSLPEVFNIVNEQTRETVESPVQKVLRDGLTVGLANHTILLARNGREIPIDDSGAPIRDADGATIGVILAFRDVTERWRAEEALRKSEERYRTTLDSILEGSQLIGFDWTYLYLNRAAAIHNRRPNEELLGRKMTDVWPGIEDTVVFAMLRRCMQERVALHEETEFVFPDRTSGWFDVRSQAVPEGVFVLSIDITERKRLELQLQQSQKMEAIGRLAGGIAHDFNNLLTAIIGYSQLLLVRGEAASSLLKPIQEIERAGQRAAGLTRQLLAFSRKQPLQPIVLDLNEAVHQMDGLLQRLIGEDVSLVTNADPDLGRVKADPGQIEQVIVNLAVNARDAMPNGGKLTIETDNVELDQHYAATHTEVVPGRYVMIAVSDTGHGMDDDTISQIFEPFFTTKGLGKGTGLGLSTVYGIVKQSGGHVWVYSEPGLGATFKVYLPRVDDVATPVERSAVRSLQGSETILLAEDEEFVRAFTRTALETYGYQVLEAPDPSEALRISREHSGLIHLMVTDVVMPGASGRELANRLQQLRTEMKVLFVSGYTDDAIVHHGVLDEGVNFLQKPFTPESLGLKVREVLDESGNN